MRVSKNKMSNRAIINRNAKGLVFQRKFLLNWTVGESLPKFFLTDFATHPSEALLSIERFAQDHFRSTQVPASVD